MLGKGVADPDYIRYAVCKKMGWDYWTYQAQPAPFIQDILTFIALERTAEETAEAEAKQKLSNARPV